MKKFIISLFLAVFIVSMGIDAWVMVKSSRKEFEALRMEKKKEELWKIIDGK